MTGDGEPTNWELARRLETIQQSLASLVGRLEYGADQRAIEHRFTELDRDIQEARDQRAQDMRELKEQRISWRLMIYTGIIPALVSAVAIIVEIFLAGKH